MKIAIVGAGFSGLALAYFLKQNGHQVTLFDEKGIGGGASGVAAGLLHPYVGFEAKKSWRSDEGMEATVQLLEIASEALGTAVFSRSGILRIPCNQEQREAFERALAGSRELERAGEGLFIPSGIAVNCKLYLQGLALAGGVEVQIRRVDVVEELAGFDRVVVAAGAGTAKLTGQTLHPMKGQVLQVASRGPSVPTIKKKYLVREGETVWIGATYERRFATEGADVEVAKREILPHFPEYAGSEIVACQAGIRVFTPDKRPLALPNVLSGLGSKGLLYHGLFAKEIGRQ